MAEAVADVVRELAAKYFRKPLKEVDLATPIDQAGDSLQFSELVIALEQRFDIVLEDSAVAGARLLSDLVPLIEARLR